VATTTGMFITGAGSVGIGTTAPAAKLHIAGVSGSDGIEFPDNTVQTTAWTGTGGAGTSAKWKGYTTTLKNGGLGGLCQR